jgi:hypothetical protein
VVGTGAELRGTSGDELDAAFSAWASAFNFAPQFVNCNLLIFDLLALALKLLRLGADQCLHLVQNGAEIIH